jgi:hypothetical protein
MKKGRDYRQDSRPDQGILRFRAAGNFKIAGEGRRAAEQSIEVGQANRIAGLLRANASFLDTLTPMLGIVSECAAPTMCDLFRS